MQITKVNELPIDAKQNEIYEIQPDKSIIVCDTHRLFNKYPTRYIPQIPRWAISKYSNLGDFVLDPFCGSGTTLVEAILHGRSGVAIDIDPFARLLTKVKTAYYSEAVLADIGYVIDQIRDKCRRVLPKYNPPDIPNIDKWFTKESIEGLSALRNFIDELCEEKEVVKDYLYIVLAAIIRRCSNAENVSPKPYISTRFPKVVGNPTTAFFEIEELYRPAIESYSRKIANMDCSNLILESNDARQIDLERPITLAVTSPPYINAYDYVRILKFENMWLGLADNNELVEKRKQYIGTENTKSFYGDFSLATQSATLNSIVPNIADIDEKRSRMVYTYFEDMVLNMLAVRKNLATGGRYVIVVGDSTIRNQTIPTSKVLIEIAEKNGYHCDMSFKYVIRDRYLHIPRGDRGGIIKYDEILVIRKI